MTKATTMAGRRRRRRAASAPERPVGGVCAISGVSIAAEANGAYTARSEPVAAIIGAALARQCARLGLADTEANRKRVRNDARLATLYGALAFLERINADAYEGHREAHELDCRYRRQVLGAAIPGDALGRGDEPDADDIRALTDRWIALQGILGMWPRSLRALVRHTWDASPDEPPAGIGYGDARRIELTGLHFARHFGLRL